MMPRRTFQQQLEEDYLPLAAAAQYLDLDKSHLSVQLRAGKLPGAFQWGHAGGGPIWIIPRVALEAYRGTHLGQRRGKNSRMPEREGGASR